VGEDGSRGLWRVGDCIPALSSAEGGPEPHPIHPPMLLCEARVSAIGGGPPFHPNCVHVLTPFVEQLATEEEKKAGMISPEVLNRTPAELQQQYRREAQHKPGRLN